MSPHRSTPSTHATDSHPPRTALRLHPVPSLLSLVLLLLGLATSVAQPAAPPTTADAPRVILTVGAPGEDDFGSNFLHQVTLWRRLSDQAGAQLSVVGLEPTSDAGPHDLARLEALLDAEPKTGLRELWLVLVGHGTFDGREARFNLRGPDLTATNLATRLAPLQRPIAVINTASASAPFMRPLAGPNRVVVTATRSGFEQNFTRFGRHLAEAMSDPEGDLDQDGQTSLLEAFLSAAARVAEFYKTEGRMATEHALLDDNGDGLGTPPDWFRGLRAVKKAKDGSGIDGLRAHQFHLLRSPAEARLSPEIRARRDALERDLATLRESRPSPPDEAWYALVEPILLDLARLYRSNAPSATAPR